jgi:hypothetical protein
MRDKIGDGFSVPADGYRLPISFDSLKQLREMRFGVMNVDVVHFVKA